MKLTRITRPAAVLLGAGPVLLSMALLTAAPAVASPASSASASAAAPTAASDMGWIRLAHLSPNTPAVDVYLYPFGDSSARIVLHHVAYGTVSAYRAVPAGDYSVAMRPAGSAAASPPVLSASTWVTAGAAYTAAALGPQSGLRLDVIHDNLTTPPGHALVRVIQASLQSHQVAVSWSGKVIVSALSFGAVTPYQAVSPGTEDVAVAAGARKAVSAVTLAPGSIHTLVVLDGATGLQVDNLTDASGSSATPAGGADTGFGGTAPRPASPLPWLALAGAGLLLTAGAGLGLWRHRLSRLSSLSRASSRSRAS